MEEARDLSPLVAADAALRLGLAKPWEVAAALQAAWDTMAPARQAFEQALARMAGLSAESLARLREEVERTLAAAGGDPVRVLAPGGAHAHSLRTIAAAGPADVSRALGNPGPDADIPLRVVPQTRYVDFHPVGEGGMGIVYWALDTEMNRQVALKIVRPDADARSMGATPDSPIHAAPPKRDTPASEAFRELKARFLQEAWVTGGLEHPGIVPVYEMGQTPDGIPYYTMRFVRGHRTLATAITEAQRAPFEKRLELLEPFLKVCDTIAYAHSRGVIHRDLKPANVALGEFGEVVVLDWGLARLRGNREPATESRWQRRIDDYRMATAMETQSALGTPGYMAPEATLGEASAVAEAGDVYSLGAILFEVLTGRLPHVFTTWAEHAAKVLRTDAPLATSIEPRVPRALSELCAQALSRVATTRPSSTRNLANAIRQWQAQSALDREVDALSAEAQAAFDAANSLVGEPRLRQFERAAGACDQLLKRRPGHPSALTTLETIAGLREAAVRERERGARQRTLRRVGVAALVLVTVSAVAVAGALRKRTTRAETAESEATAAGKASEAALRRVRALALARESENWRPTDPVLSLLLAREACRVGGDVPSDALAALHRSVTPIAQRHATFAPPAPISSVAFSPTGDRFLVVNGDWTVSVFSPKGVPICVFEGHTEAITCAAFNPAGDRVVTASHDNTARLWGLDGEELAVLKGDDDEGITWAVFSPTGDRILTTSWTTSARLWDLEGRMLATCTHVGDDLSWAAFAPAGDRVVTASHQGTTRLWDLDGKELAACKGHEGEITWVSFSLQGDRILTASADHTARVWSLAGKELAICRGHADEIRSAVLSPSGDRLLTASNDGTARLWTLDGNEVATCKGHTSRVYTAAFSPSGDRILTASADGTARLWRLDGTELTILQGHTNEVNCARFNTAGDVILTGSDDGTARLWSIGGTELARVSGRPGGVETATFAADGARILTTSGDRTVRLWSLDGRQLAVCKGHTDWISSASFSPTGDQVLTASNDGTARLWSLDGRSIAVCRGHTDRISSAAFSPTGDQVLTASDDGTARLWGLDGSEHAVCKGHKGERTTAVFSPSGDRVITASKDGTARTWDLRGHELTQSRGDWQRSTPLLSPTGNWVLSRYKGGFSLFSLDGKERARFACDYDDSLRAPAVFSPVGDCIFAYGLDGTAWLYAVDGREIAKIKGTDGSLNHVGFSPSGDRLLTAHGDGTARVCFLNGRLEQLAVVPTTERAVHVASSADPGILLLVSARGLVTVWSGPQAGPGLGSRSGADLNSRAPSVPPRPVVIDAAYVGTSSTIATLDAVGNVSWYSPHGTDATEYRALSRVDAANGVAPGKPKRFAVAPAGLQAVVSYADAPGRIIDGATHEITPLLGHADWASRVEPLPHGQGIAAFYSNGSVRTWSLDGVPGRRWQPIPGAALVSISPTGDQIVYARGSLAHLLGADGADIATFKGHSADITHASFSTRGDRILTVGQDATVRLWSLQGQELAVCRGHTGTINSAALSAGNDQILTASDDRTARIWSTSGAPLSVCQGHEAGVTSAAYSPSGSLVLTASEDGTARLWNLQGRELAVCMASGRKGRLGVTVADFSPAGDRILTCYSAVLVSTPDDHRNVRLWSLEGRELPFFDRSKRGEGFVDSARFSPAGDRILAIDSYNTARLCELSGRELASWSRAVGALFVAPDRIVILDQGAKLRLLSADGQDIAELVTDGGPIGSAHYSTSGQFFLTTGDCTARVWSRDGKEHAVCRGHDQFVQSAMFSSSDHRVLTASADDTARLWDLDGRELAVFRVQGPASARDGTSVFALADLAPTTDHVLTASEWDRANCVHIWAVDGPEVAVCQGHTSYISTATFSSTGSHLLTAAKQDGTARVWDLTGRTLGVLTIPNAKIESAQYARPDDRILTISNDGAARVWTPDFRELFLLTVPDDPVLAAALRGDGAQVLTRHESGVRLWTIDPQRLLLIADEAVGRDFTPDELARFGELLGSASASSK